MKRLIIFAVLPEARATLHQLDARMDEDGVYRFDQGIVAVAGMGVLSASQAVCKYAGQVDNVWNIGIAGALRDDLLLGTLCEVSVVHRNPLMPKEGDEYSQTFQNNVFPPIQLGTGRQLVSADYPIHQEELRRRLAARFDLVDMEGYGVASAARACGLPCRLWKVVSDFARPGGQVMIEQQLATASEKIAEHIVGLVECDE